MKAFILSAIAFGLSEAASGQAPVGTIDKTQKLDTLEVSCGMCQFEMSGNDCALAARVNEKHIMLKAHT